MRFLTFACTSTVALKEGHEFINETIHCDGVVAKPGDIVCGDDDGVVPRKWLNPSYRRLFTMRQKRNRCGLRYEGEN